MSEKLMQNRTVVVGRTTQDANAYANRKNLKDAVLVNASHHRLTILGSLAGMHAAEVHFTGTAPEGPSFEHVESALENLLNVNPDLTIVEEPRVIQA